MLSDQGRVFYGLFACCSKRNPNSVEIPWWKQLACWTWRCNPLVLNLPEMVTSLCQHHVGLHQGLTKNSCEVFFRRRCVLRDNICIGASRMQSWQNAMEFWLGIPLLNMKIRWWLASWLERSSNSSLSKLSWEQIAENFHTFFHRVSKSPKLKIKWRSHPSAVKPLKPSKTPTS